MVIHGNSMTKNENTNQVITQFCWDYLDYELYNEDLDRSHRLFSTLKKDDQTKSPPIIAKFVSHNVTFTSKKNSSKALHFSLPNLLPM